MSDAPERVTGLVLAAGGSTRLGIPKQLIEFRGEPLVRRAARSAADAGAAPVIVVVGASAADVVQALDGLPFISIIANECDRDRGARVGTGGAGGRRAGARARTGGCVS